MNLFDLLRIVTHIVVIILFFITYTYIEKLERIGCPCASHPYRDFVKGTSIFAVIYLLITMFISPVAIFNTFGKTGSILYMIFNFFFVILMIVFFILAMQYTYKLIKDKCHCSEDVRREVIHYWSIIELTIYTIIIIVPLIIAVTDSSLAVIMSSVKYTHNSADKVHDIMVNPIDNVKKIPSSLKTSAKAVSKLLKKRRV